MYRAKYLNFFNVYFPFLVLSILHKNSTWELLKYDMMNYTHYDFSSQSQQSNDDFFFCVLAGCDFGKNYDRS